ncbi:hypothetical protein [Anaerosporobacter sp.]|uniref:hypothetical protein n=1 Tax=Anaerosporobacter sp. TaxID=1872529 RepID=UPI00286ED017|nr:hypothetical protein [Anaerosporobacter sp.]
MDKGTYGYIKYKKKVQLRNTIIIALIGIIIFVVGYLLNDNSRNNVFTIVSVLLALPGAKMLVGYVVVAPYQSMDSKEYEQVCKAVPPDATMISDLVMTSPDKVMNLDCAVVDDRHVIVLLGKAGQDTSYIQTYLARTIKNQGYSCEVKVLTDFGKYLLRVKTLGKQSEQPSEQSNEHNEQTKEQSSEQVEDTTESNARDEIVHLLKTLNV